MPGQVYNPPMSPAKEIIKLGQTEIRFLLEPEDTGGVQSVFEFAVVPGARVPSAHYHRDFEELLYGLEGVLTFTVDGKVHQLGPGDHCFVPRGAVHHFINLGEFTTRTLGIITPGLLGPAYFREMAEILVAGVQPDPARVSEIMTRHGLFPAL